MPPIFSLANLHRQYLRCRRNKRTTHNALRFEVCLEEHLVQLHEELEGRTYQPARSVCFVVKQPKFREIFAADFRDRVVHHVLVEALERVWEPIFLHDSYACRKGKGTHRAVRRLQQFMRSVSRNDTRPAFALHLDIQGFFFHIDKEILFAIIAKRIRDEALLWLARTVIFHDCTQAFVYKGDRRLRQHIPPHKTLFGTENVRGLPIGNLSSQFFSNVYLNELDQFVKHQLKARYYLRYSDDFVLLHEDPNQLLTWREAIAVFVHDRLRLRLTDPQVAPRPLSNGLNFVGYIVRPDYLLVRRRSVRRLKMRLAQYEQQLVRQERGYTLYRHDAVVLESLRAMWASYRAHFTMANTFRLQQALVKRFQWVREFFEVEQGLLVSRWKVPVEFPSLRVQYRFFAHRFPEAIVLFQVGCFFECYDGQAEQALQLFRLRRLKAGRGFRVRCGFPVRLLPRYRDWLLRGGLSVAVIREDASSPWLGRVKARHMAEHGDPRKLALGNVG